MAHTENSGNDQVHGEIECRLLVDHVIVQRHDVPSWPRPDSRTLRRLLGFCTGPTAAFSSRPKSFALSLSAVARSSAVRTILSLVTASLLSKVRWASIEPSRAVNVRQPAWQHSFEHLVQT
jgi:hypothetical protein